MKKTAAYIFLFVYVVVLCKPITPIISDGIAHAFYYSQHMATVHYENGKMHLHQELIKKACEENSSKDQGLVKKSQATDEYISPGNNQNAIQVICTKISGIMLPGVFINISPDITTPPPRLI
ncbi:MAG: hypothetical protein ABIW38_10715 [Ferruginibacter sp.]